MEEIKGDEKVMRILRASVGRGGSDHCSLVYRAVAHSPQDQSGKGEGEEQDDMPAIWHPARERTAIHGEAARDVASVRLRLTECLVTSHESTCNSGVASASAGARSLSGVLGVSAAKRRVK
jgi:hypothetical protein